MGRAVGVVAQGASRLTGTTVAEQLDVASQSLSRRAQANGNARLVATSQQMSGMATALRNDLGGDLAKPVEIIDEKKKAEALRAYAAVLRVQAYLDSPANCRGSASTAMGDALALSVEKLASTPPSSASAQPVINTIETSTRQPLFASYAGADPLVFALTGVNLHDPQCPDTQVTITDAQGRPVKATLSITNVSPARIELSLSGAAALQPGGYVLHVVPQRKAFLLGCSKLPEALGAIQLAAPVHIDVDYAVVASCRASGGAPHEVSLGSGSMPTITAYGMTVSRRVDIGACAEPLNYTVKATAKFDDGSPDEPRSMTQSADASITTGLPGGLSLSWNPQMQQLFVRSDANTCKGG